MELLYPVTFAGGTANRAGLRRRDEAWLAEARLAASARVIVVRSASRLLVAGGEQLGQVRAADLPEGADLTFLGLDGSGAAIFVFDGGPDEAPRVGNAMPVPDGHAFEELRALAARLPAEEAAVAAHAVAMAGWHRRHRYCGSCGAPTAVQEAGHARRCTVCGTQHHPRTDPVVIMLVTDGERCVLGRRPGGRGWSVLAGFVEPGETPEQAVAREVHEEVGLRVTAARYLASQPWPFPSNLMLGFEALAAYEPLQVDDELEEARWFTRRELRDGLEAGTLSIPASISIAHHLVRAWLAEDSGSSRASQPNHTIREGR